MDYDAEGFELRSIVRAYVYGSYFVAILALVFGLGNCFLPFAPFYFPIFFALGILALGTEVSVGWPTLVWVFGIWLAAVLGCWGVMFLRDWRAPFGLLVLDVAVAVYAFIRMS